MLSFRNRRLVAVAAFCLALATPLAPPSLAQQGGPPQREAQRPAERGRLPADSITRHTLDLPGRTLRFTATAGSLPLVDPQGAVQAEIGYVAYTLDGEGASRPVTFAVNGGPGAASAYLHLGVLGPWRLPLDGSTISPSAPVALVANPETWLDFTDLVFIDPVGTGYSRAVTGDARERYYGVEADITTLSAIVARYLREKDRLASPKFFIGESYGGFRGPLLAEKLQSEFGIGLSGMTLLSPVLDFSFLNAGRHDPTPYVARLPSIAAAALERRGDDAPSRQKLAEAESYASGDYLVDLTRGLRDRDAVERLSARVAALTGLAPDLVRRHAGRVDMSLVQRESERAEGRIVSAYDTGIFGYDPDPTAFMSRFADPGLTAMTAPLTSAIVDHLSRTLQWRVTDRRYELLAGSVSGGWNWGRGRGAPESVSELRQALALDAKLRVLIAHGFTDLVTPYFASQMVIDQLPDYGPERRVSLAVYPGGHMFYSRDRSRKAFREDALALYRSALHARGVATR